MTLLALVLAAVASTQAPEIALERVAEGLIRPVALAHAGDGRLFISEQGGLIKVLDGNLHSEPFLDLSSLISMGERGLLGLAFDPDYADNGFFFVNYTAADGATNAANPASARTILRIAHVADFSNGIFYRIDDARPPGSRRRAARH